LRPICISSIWYGEQVSAEKTNRFRNNTREVFSDTWPSTIERHIYVLDKYLYVLVFVIVYYNFIENDNRVKVEDEITKSINQNGRVNYQ
jgi:hypothetical protein